MITMLKNTDYGKYASTRMTLRRHSVYPLVISSVFAHWT